MSKKELTSKKISIKEYPLLSEKFHEIAEDLEDAYWIATHKDTVKRNEYVNADLLDKYLVKTNAYTRK